MFCAWDRSFSGAVCLSGDIGHISYFIFADDIVLVCDDFSHLFVWLFEQYLDRFVMVSSEVVIPEHGASRNCLVCDIGDSELRLCVDASCAPSQCEHHGAWNCVGTIS